jgi:hypothetical protein
LVDGRRDGARSESTAGRAGELAIAPPLAGARRAWLASSAGLALFDRERELALLEREPWPAVAVGAGTGSESGAPTSLHARGPRAVVLAPTLLYSFRTDRR